MAWMPIIKRAVVTAHTMLSGPGKNAKNGIGISITNMRTTSGRSNAAGSFCAYHPIGEGRGCQTKNPFR